jgi:hypothetical protein
MAGRVNIDIFNVNRTLQNTYAFDAKLTQKGDAFFSLGRNAPWAAENDGAGGNR